MAERNWLYALRDNLIGYDDGVTTPGERLGRGVNALATALYNDPTGTVANALLGVKGDLDDLMFRGGAERRPGDVFNYAAGSMAPGALAKAPAGALRSGPARRLDELDLDALRDEYEFLGLRTVEGGTDPLAPSRVWDDGSPTEDFLDGVSATDIDDPNARAMHRLTDERSREGFYFGDDTYLIGGNDVSRGEDVGELIIKDPVLLSSLARKYGIAGAAVMLGISESEVEAAVR